MPEVEFPEAPQEFPSDEEKISETPPYNPLKFPFVDKDRLPPKDKKNIVPDISPFDIQ